MNPNTVIRREPESARNTPYHLIIIGGGIYGAMLALESARRGLKPLLLEKEDFGGQTSFNSLRIIHGGLRYLQKLDLHRFRESVGERKWFLKTFPNLVKPLACLMPLYGTGMHRPAILKVALLLNDQLSANRNQGIRVENHLPNGSVIGINETRRIFPDVFPEGLKGAAKWHDAVMLNSQRVLIEVLRWSCQLGATLLNYVEADELLLNGSSVSGVTAVDQLDGSCYHFQAPIVVNAAGPWSRSVAGTCHRDIPELFQPSLAWNMLLDKPSLSDHALAVSPQKHEGHTYFLVPWQGKIFAGTGHAPIQWTPGQPIQPSDEHLSGFLADLNTAVPGLKLTLSDIAYVHAGLLPVKRSGGTDLTVREVIVNHGTEGGPQGFYSVSGIKFTTARLVAEKTLKVIAPELATRDPEELTYQGLYRYEQAWKALLMLNGERFGRDNFLSLLNTIIQEESVCRPEDVIFRRTSLYENQDRARSLTCEIIQMLQSQHQVQVKE